MIRPSTACDTYITTEELSISGYTIPKGFEFDGMSAPWILRSFVGGPYRPRLLKAVILHDYLYLTKVRSRYEADKVFYNMLKHIGVKCAILFYLAVRLFGWKHYR